MQAPSFPTPLCLKRAAGRGHAHPSLPRSRAPLNPRPISPPPPSSPHLLSPSLFPLLVHLSLPASPRQQFSPAAAVSSNFTPRLLLPSIPSHIYLSPASFRAPFQKKGQPSAAAVGRGLLCLAWLSWLRSGRNRRRLALLAEKPVFVCFLFLFERAPSPLAFLVVCAPPPLSPPCLLISPPPQHASSLP